MGHPDWNTSFPLPLGSDSERSASLWLAQAGNAQRQAFEQFIRQRFDEAHGARISSFMPDLFGLHDAEQQLSAVCGARLAVEQPLFLEQYLDAPVEQIIAMGQAIIPSIHSAWEFVLLITAPFNLVKWTAISVLGGLAAILRGLQPQTTTASG